MRLLVALLFASACAAGARAGRYHSRALVQSGSCCSASCAAISMRASVELTLERDGRAEARWRRSGCNLFAAGDGPHMMPHDPGPPEQVCGWDPTSYKITRHDGAGELSGRWHRTSDGLTRVDLTPNTGGGEAWHLSCIRLQPKRGRGLPRPLVACRFLDAAYTTTAGLTVRPEGFDQDWLLLRAGDGVRTCAINDGRHGEAIAFDAACPPDPALGMK